LKKKILVNGKTSRFCKYLKNELDTFKTFFVSKKQFNILNFRQMDNYVKNKKITHLLHIAGLSRPMSIHDTEIQKSIDLNIIGTSNIVKVCKKNNIKLIYFSTSYVYPGIKGNYSESDYLYPINNYAWSKLGGEAAVKMYKNSLILRLCMTDYPFVHKKAISKAYSSFIYNKYVAMIIPFLLNEKGVLNIGGKKREIYEFAKKFGKKNIKKIPVTKVKNFPKDSSIKIDKLIKIIRKNKLKKIIL
tara:strand:+ start:549 stop:1283 length:735 start_codon:yes stop_codon:yes gene_type:complete